MNHSDRTNSELILQIKKTIQSLETKVSASKERLPANYLERYRFALSVLISSEDTAKIIPSLIVLLHLARGYMETSSYYQQSFLTEMGKTEELIKEFMGSFRYWNRHLTDRTNGMISRDKKDVSC